MPRKKKKYGGLTRKDSIDYTDLTKRAAPTGKFRIIVKTEICGYKRLGDYTSLVEAKKVAEEFVEANNPAVAYIHNESNRVLYRV